jgi:predicted alpha/beta-hydrolase family hydrolase
MTKLTIDTPHGPARAELHCAPEGRAGLLLGHGAGGGVGAPDLVAATRAAVAAGVHVALVEQPYRVAGRRAPAPAPALDEAWVAVVTALAADHAGVPLIVGGRSSGARVACRTATALGAAGVVALAFPTRPPQRPDSDRLAELALPVVPVLVVQGERDAFGVPPAARRRTVRVIAGADHSLRRDPAAVAAAVLAWLARHITRPAASSAYRPPTT